MLTEWGWRQRVVTGRSMVFKLKTGALYCVELSGCPFLGGRGRIRLLAVGPSWPSPACRRSSLAAATLGALATGDCLSLPLLFRARVRGRVSNFQDRALLPRLWSFLLTIGLSLERPSLSGSAPCAVCLRNPLGSAKIPRRKAPAIGVMAEVGYAVTQLECIDRRSGDQLRQRASTQIGHRKQQRKGEARRETRAHLSPPNMRRINITKQQTKRRLLLREDRV